MYQPVGRGTEKQATDAPALPCRDHDQRRTSLRRHPRQCIGGMHRGPLDEVDGGTLTLVAHFVLRSRFVVTKRTDVPKRFVDFVESVDRAHLRSEWRSQILGPP